MKKILKKRFNLILALLLIIGISNCTLFEEPSNTTNNQETNNDDPINDDPNNNVPNNEPEDTTVDVYLGDHWVNTVQQDTTYNYTLSNSDLLLGNQSYTAISYSGYRLDSRGDGLVDKDSYCPTVEEIKEDMKILYAMGIRLLRTYDTQQYLHAERLMQAITELKSEDDTFEMYVMVGAWIQCEGAYTASVDHSIEDLENNTAEIEKAIELAYNYPDIVKVIAVGNEAMVTWQAHYVPADIILKWVKFVKDAKTTAVNGMLVPADTLVTSSDNFATWGGQDDYKDDTLLELINEVDFISLHTYPFHDSHYNSAFWEVPAEDSDISDEAKIEYSMNKAFEYAVMQYRLVKDYLSENNIEKAIHIGETGWASLDSGLYSATGSRAADELKSQMFYKAMREWSAENNVSMFYFEAFDEPWKGGETGSESHFGIFTVDGKAKYAIWDLVDDNIFSGLTRGGNTITKTYNGVEADLMADVLPPPYVGEEGTVGGGISDVTLGLSNPDREAGVTVTENTYIINSSLLSADDADKCYSSDELSINAWEGTCTFEETESGELLLTTGTGSWWGAALEMSSGTGEDMTNFINGNFHFTIKGDTLASIEVGFQTGIWGNAERPQKNCYVTFGADGDYQLTADWVEYSIPVQTLMSTDTDVSLTDTTSLLYVKGVSANDGGLIDLKEVYWTQD